MSEEDKAKLPRSMVIKIGEKKRQVTNSLSQLVQDFRQIMLPHTAAKLRERKSNRLRDFITMAGPLGVSHLMIFSQSVNGNTTLRIAKTPRGPTLNFRVLQYSLCKDVQKFIKNFKTLNAADLLQPPLLVMNGFSSNQRESSKDALLTSLFQNMFPSISTQATKVSSIKRVLMLNRLKDRETDTIDIRHYVIETRIVDGSKQVKKLSTVKSKLGKQLPNMSRAEDISDYLLDPYGGGGYTSESEVEEENMTVEVEQNEANNKKTSNEGSKIKEHTTQKRAIKLIEVGPRLRLELRKIEEGICEGKTLYHAFVDKSKEEVAALEKKHQLREALRQQRRKEQEENVRKKKEADGNKTSRTKRGLLKAKAQTEAEVEIQETEDEDSDDLRGDEEVESEDEGDKKIDSIPDDSSESEELFSE